MLLTVHNLPAGTPVKLAVMERFDGTVWNLSDSSEATDSSNYHRVGTTIKADEQGKSFTATFTVAQGLTDTWLPLAGAATGVSFANDADNGNDTFYYNTDTDSAIIPAGTRKGLTYTESGIIARNPTDKQISSAAAARITQPSPGCPRFGQKTGHVHCRRAVLGRCRSHGVGRHIERLRMVLSWT